MKKHIKWLALIYVCAIAVLMFLEVSHFREVDRVRGQIGESYELISGRDEGLRLELEYRRFRGKLAGYVNEIYELDEQGQLSPVTYDEMMNWFDIFWSRAFSVKSASINPPDISNQVASKLFVDIRQSLREIDPLVQALKPGDTTALSMISAKLEGFDRRITELANSISHNRVEQASQLQENLNWALKSIDALLVMSGTGSVLILTLFGIEAFRARWAERQIKSREMRVLYLAEHDTLTGLGNRAYLNNQMEDFIHNANATGERFYLLLLDLDKFKDVNDTFGHPVGDRLLKSAATRLIGIFRPEDIVVRLGGDEFAILMKSDFDIVEIAISRIVKALSSSFLIGSNEIHISTSIGVSSYPNLSNSIDNLMRDADLALYEAKNKGCNTWMMYHPTMSVAIKHRITLEADLRQALQNDGVGLEVYYQPQVAFGGSCDRSEITGVEALVRWFHPDHGQIPTLEFIEIAESTGIINQLSDWIMSQACQDVRMWHKAGFEIGLSVNLSPFQLNNPNLPAEVMGHLEQSGLDPHFLTLEITESADVRDAGAAAAMLTELADKGISLAMDDFGTGYSNLSYLNNLPLHCLKIDRAFVTHIDGREEDRKLVRGIINLARGMGLKVVAEGVETEAQMEFLYLQNCQIGQGYLFGRPMNKLKMITLLKERHEARAKRISNLDGDIVIKKVGI